MAILGNGIRKVLFLGAKIVGASSVNIPLFYSGHVLSISDKKNCSHTHFYYFAAFGAVFLPRARFWAIYIFLMFFLLNIDTFFAELRLKTTKKQIV